MPARPEGIKCLAWLCLAKVSKTSNITQTYIASYIIRFSCRCTYVCMLSFVHILQDKQTSTTAHAADHDEADFSYDAFM